MKYIYVFIIGFLLLPSFVFADIDHTKLEHPKVVLENLAEHYSEKLCRETTDEEWELLGESFMQAMAGNTEQHEFMDEMHGGEGSQELLAFHIFLGKRYAGCDVSDNNTSTTMMQGWGKDNSWRNFRMHGMMWENNWGTKYFSPYTYHSFGWSILIGIIHITVWFIILAFSVFVIRKVWEASGPRKK